VNAVAPNPVTNAEFTRALGAALNRPAALRPPAWAVRLAVGEMADALLLSSTRVLPARLLRTGFEFRHPALPAALRELLNTARG
jgi:NAD dependent epimerase/dehydratase family enzyme